MHFSGVKLQIIAKKDPFVRHFWDQKGDPVRGVREPGEWGPKQSGSQEKERNDMST